VRASRRLRRVGAAIAAGERLGTRRPVSCGHRPCRARATYVPGRARYEPPGGTRCSSNVPRCGASSRGLGGSPADCRGEGKKSFCYVTTRRRNLRLLNGLGSLTAFSFGLGVAAFGCGIPATFGLAPCRQPAPDLPLAFRLLAVALVPTPWQVLAPAPFAETNPWARPAHSGRRAVFSRNLTSAHGRCFLPRESSGRMCNHSPRALSKRQPDTSSPA
jgi:hypothetical protein